MPYTSELRLNLQDFPSEQLIDFTSLKGAHVVLPNETVGGNLTTNSKNPRQITIYQPTLKKRVTFFSADAEEWTKRCMVIYNMISSLGTCTIVHSLDEKTNQFVIQIVTDYEPDLIAIDTIHYRFDHPKSAETKQSEKENQRQMKARWKTSLARIKDASSSKDSEVSEDT